MQARATGERLAALVEQLGVGDRPADRAAAGSPVWASKASESHR